MDWSDQDEHFAIGHIDHCIDIIRQGLQCNADITPLSFVWSSGRNRSLEAANVIHTCTDFDAIWKWGLEHQMKVNFDSYTQVKDDILCWGGK